MQKGPPTPKGFRDIAPDLAKKRRRVINKIIETLEKFDFVPLETPIIEFAQTLTGKYGEEEKLIYQFEDKGGRKLALRYDLTVPLARYIANNPSIEFPFRRYQLGQVFRGENPQAGRYREFTQFDFDTVGSNEKEEDAKIIAAATSSVKGSQMLINDRKNFENLPIEVVRTMDKIHKIGEDGIISELKSNGFKENEISKYINKINNAKPTKDLEIIFTTLEEVYKLKQDTDFRFDPTLARGLDYYTGPIFELKPSQDVKSLSIGSGGRYDNLIGMFAQRNIPATGFSFGVDRLTELAL